LVELAGALSGLALWAAFPYSPLLLAYVPFVMALLALSVIDLEQGLLPDAITLPGIALGLILAAFLPGLDFFEALTGAVTGGILFQAVAWGYKKWSGRPGLGGGDIKLMAMIGAFLGFESLPWVILGSATLGTLAGAALVLAKGEWQGGKWRTLQMPFGPFLAAGALVYLWGGEYLLRFGEAGGLG
jgi:leader peptidase (prepilin peptidase)/N-methyltransferase